MKKKHLFHTLIMPTENMHSYSRNGIQLHRLGLPSPKDFLDNVKGKSISEDKPRLFSELLLEIYHSL